jgi:hypothetical protein
MAKILSVHQIYCRVNQRTQLSFNGKLGDELCLAVKELSKEGLRRRRDTVPEEFLGGTNCNGKEKMEESRRWRSSALKGAGHFRTQVLI